MHTTHTYTHTHTRKPGKVKKAKTKMQIDPSLQVAIRSKNNKTVIYCSNIIIKPTSH